MNIDEDFVTHINEMTELAPVLQLIQAMKLDDKSLEETERKMVMGTEIKVHYKWLETGTYIFKAKDGTITVRGKTYLAEEIWNEIDERIALGKKALLDRATIHSVYKPRETQRGEGKSNTRLAHTRLSALSSSE